MRASLPPLLALPALLAAGCGGDDDGGGPSRQPLAVATYNAGLAVGFVDYAEARAPVTSAALAGLDVDLLCVQEYWKPEHVDALRQATAATLPQALFLDPAPTDEGAPAPTEPPCDHPGLDVLEACVDEHCAGVPTDQLAGCVLGSCGEQFDALSGACQGCLAANIGASLEQIRVTCTLPGGGGYAYGGSFGIGLLTSAEVLASDSLRFTSTYNRRAVLHNHLRHADGRELHVFCTHLTAVFDDIPWPKAEGSWAEEQAAQIDALLAFVDERAGAAPTVLLGDLNTGPAVGDVSAEAPENYGKLPAAGFASAYLEGPAPECTFCFDNPLVGGADHSASGVIDHVLVRNLTATAPVERILTGEVTVEYEGGQVVTRYSDHYGLRAEL